MGKRPDLLPRKIFLAEWIKAIDGKTRKGAAEAAHMDISTINNICGGRRRTGDLVMLAFANYLGITVDDLYRPPPSNSTLQELTHLSATAREALLRRPANSRHKKAD